MASASDITAALVRLISTTLVEDHLVLEVKVKVAEQVSEQRVTHT
jgi:hypothetical protein